MASAEVATPEQLVGEAENHRMVAEVVSGLEEPFRQTLVLHYYDGLSSAEIARRLGLPEGTIRSRIKRGLDRVRVRLDARHGGDRRAWVRSLLPLVPVVPRTGSSLLLLFKAAAAVAAASFAAVVLTVLFARGPASPVAGGEPPHAPLSRYAALVTRTQDGQAGEPGGSGPLLPGTTSPLPGPLEPRLLACRGRLAVAHEQRIALEADLREWDHDFLYALGEPNPAAELALAPLVMRALEQGRFDVQLRFPLRPRPAILEHRLGCRRWACRLVLRLEQGSRVPERFRGDLVGDPELTARISRVDQQLRLYERDVTPAVLMAHSFAPRSNHREELGKEGDESQIYVLQLRLRQPSGEPLPDATMAPPTAAPAEPVTLASCEAAITTLEQDVAELHERWARVEPLDEKFARSQEPPHPGLARLVEDRQPWFTNLLANTECRGRVCRQTNRYQLLGRTFWEKPAGPGRRLSRGNGADSVTYQDFEQVRPGEALLANCTLEIMTILQWYSALEGRVLAEVKRVWDVANYRPWISLVEK